MKRHARKGIALALTFCMLISMFSGLAFGVSASQFTDISRSHWAYQYVDDVVSRGLFAGLSDTTFGPEVKMNRAMFVTVLSRLDNATVDNNATTVFTDVPTGQWYSGAVAWGAENNIVAGVTETTFEPESLVTREQMASLLIRYADYADIDLEDLREATNFTDDSSISSYARDAVKQCQRSGVINGYEDGSFKPQGTATRAEVSVILSIFVSGADIDADYYTVTFNSNGGTDVESQRIEPGGKVTRPTNPTRTSYRFDGWYTESALTNLYDFNTEVTSSFTLYAKWTYLGSGSSSSNRNRGDRDPATTYNITFDLGDGVDSIVFTDGRELDRNDILTGLPVDESTLLEFMVKAEAGYKVKADSVKIDTTTIPREADGYFKYTATEAVTIAVEVEETGAYAKTIVDGEEVTLYNEVTKDAAGEKEVFICVPAEETDKVTIFIEGTFAATDIATTGSNYVTSVDAVRNVNGYTAIDVTLAKGTVTPDWGTSDLEISDDTLTHKISFHASSVWVVNIEGQGSVTINDNGFNDDVYKVSHRGVTDLNAATKLTFAPSSGYFIGDVSITNLAGDDLTDGATQVFTSNAAGTEYIGATKSVTYIVDVKFIQPPTFTATYSGGSIVPHRGADYYTDENLKAYFIYAPTDLFENSQTLRLEFGETVTSATPTDATALATTVSGNVVNVTILNAATAHSAWNNADITVKIDGVDYKVSIYKSAIMEVTVTGSGEVTVQEDQPDRNAVTITEADGEKYVISGEVGVDTKITLIPDAKYTGTGTINIAGGVTLNPDALTTIPASDIEAKVYELKATFVEKTVTVGSGPALQAALNSGEYAEIKLDGDIDLGEDITLLVTDSGVTIDGNNKVLKTKADASNKVLDVLVIENTSDVTVKDLEVEVVFDNIDNTTSTNGGKKTAAYGIQVYNSENITLDGITASGGHAGIIVNSSDVTLKGAIKISDTKWGGIEVCTTTTIQDADQGVLTIDADVELTYDDESDTKPAIWIDDYAEGAGGKVIDETESLVSAANPAAGKDQMFYFTDAENLPSANEGGDGEGGDGEGGDGEGGDGDGGDGDGDGDGGDGDDK